MYKFLLLSLFFSLHASTSQSPWDELLFYRNYDQYIKSGGEIDFNADCICISLGAFCQTAVQLNYYQLRNGAFPFDWLLTDSTDAITELLDNDFKFFFDEKYLFSNPTVPYRLDNSYYKFEFRYEWLFPDVTISEERIKSMIATSAPKYARRIERFRKLRKFSGKVFFIRTASCLDPDYYWRDEAYAKITQIQSQKLCDALRHFFPDLHFDLIIINYSDEIDTSINQWGEHIFEMKVTSRFTHAFDSFIHVFEFIKRNNAKSDH